MTTRDKLIRHSHYVERYKTGQANLIDNYLKRVDKVLREILTRTEGITNKAQLRLIQKELRIEMRDIYREWANKIDINLVDFAASEAGFAARASGTGLIIPSRHILAAAIRSRPFTTVLLRDELNGYITSQIKLIKNAIAEGFYVGESNAQIMSRIRGTKARNYKDGLLSMSKRKAERIVRTAINHTAAQARASLIAANSDIFTHYEWVATLDSRTSDICRGLDGKKFKIGKGRLPPAHPNCRSTIIPVM